MKTKLILTLSGLLLGSSVLMAQADCATQAALAYDDAKAESYAHADQNLIDVK